MAGRVAGLLAAEVARRGGGPAAEFHGRPWVVCTGRRGEGSSDERTMLLLVSWRRESR